MTRTYCKRGMLSHVEPFHYLFPDKKVRTLKELPFAFAMVNPVITRKSGAYQTEEGCLSLDGVRPCTRYEEIEVDYLDSNFKKQHGKYTGWTAQIIQHEIDHCNG